MATDRAPQSSTAPPVSPARTEAATADETAESAVRSVMHIGTAYWLSRSLHVVAELGVADALGDTPLTPAVLASAVGAHPQSLSRVLRLLAAHGVFEQRENRFAHTPASQLLRSDHPRSLRPFLRMIGLDALWQSFGELEQTVRTGETAFEALEPGGIFKYFADHPEEGRIFDAAMTAKAHGEVAGVLGAYDFSKFTLIADIGGGRGHLLRAVLESAPAAQGILFDLPHVVAQVAVDPPEGLHLEAGDFFEDRLPSCDAYLLMDVLHDWNDDKAAAILANLRRAAPEGATLLVIGQIIGDEAGPDWGKLLDVNMMANTGGRERTRAEYDALLGATGFRLQRVIPAGPSYIIEAIAT